jgi:hypothetical protein
MIYFACDIAAGEPHLVNYEENIEVRWSTLDEAAELLTPTGGRVAADPAVPRAGRSGPWATLTKARPSVPACYMVRDGRLLMVRRQRREGALEFDRDRDDPRGGFSARRVAQLRSR